MPLFEQPAQKLPSNLLKDKFGYPPFSILDTTAVEWQKRKKEWEAILPNSLEGRDPTYKALPTDIYGSHGIEGKAKPVSEFDPFLCELMYRWFSKDGDMILDPFAGGSVRGCVAGVLNRPYTGVDLSPEQVCVNEEHLDALNAKYQDVPAEPEWVCADAEQWTYLAEGVMLYDMVFTCPPYYNLEKYTDNPNDLSNMPSYDDFLDKYTNILCNSVKLLKEDSFFVIVVSEVRGDRHKPETTGYYGLVPDTIKILKDKCSLHYYNELILATSLGSLPVRVSKQFEASRKIGRRHQNILVFYKGKIANIREKFGTDF